MRSRPHFVRAILIALLAMAIALFVRLTLLQVYAVPSESMLPTLRSGDRIAMVPYTSWIAPRLPERGDVIVFRRGSQLLVKRIVAVPGDQIPAVETDPTNGSASAPRENGTLQPGRYFVLGDNRPISADSRQWGPIDHSQIVGEVIVILWSSPREEKGEETGRGARRAGWLDLSRVLQPVR